MPVKTTIPGIAAKGIAITDNCRRLHGDDGAFNEAVDLLRAEYRACVAARKQSGLDKGVKYHLVLTVESP